MAGLHLGTLPGTGRHGLRNPRGTRSPPRRSRSNPRWLAISARSRARAPRLKWFHQRPAGASNLLMGDLWGSRVVVTTSRGLGNTLAMAEYALAGILHFAKGFHRAAVDRGAGVFDHRAYRPLLLEGKTAC